MTTYLDTRRCCLVVNAERVWNGQAMRVSYQVCVDSRGVSMRIFKRVRLLKIFGRAIPYSGHQPAMEMRDRPGDPRFRSDDPRVLHVLPWIQSSALYSTVRCGGSVTSWAQGLEPTPLAACEVLSCAHIVCSGTKISQS